MSKNTKIVIALLAVFAVALGVLAVMAGNRSAGQSAAATATVVEALRERNRGDDDTVVVLSYPAGGATAQGRARVSGVHVEDYPAGRQLPVCYDPKDTASVRIADGPCG